MATNKPMSLTTAKAVAKNPYAYSTQELDDALTVIVDSEDLTEAQVTRMQAKIDPVIRQRIAFAKRVEDDPPADENLKQVFKHFHYDPVLIGRAIDYLTAHNPQAGA